MSRRDPFIQQIPFLREIPLYAGDWGGIRGFLVDIRNTLERYIRTPEKPSQVVGFNAIPQNMGVWLNWEITPNTAAYRIYRGATFSTAIILAEVVGHTTRYFVDCALYTGTFYYWITGLNSFGEEGPVSAQISATANPPISDTYTPTLTDGTNIAASTPYPSHYIRVGNEVTVSGVADVDPTAGAGTASTLGISLPIASNFAATTDCLGTAASATVLETGGIGADTGNDRALLSFLAQTTANHAIFYHFTYTVI